MQIKANRAELIQKCSIIEHAMPRRSDISSLPCINGIHAEKKGNILTLTTNNLEMAIKTRMEVDGNGAGDSNDGTGATILNKKFIPVLKKLPDVEVELFVDEDSNRANIKCGKSEFNLSGMDAEEFPEFTETYKTWQTVKLDAKELLDIIDKTTYCVSADSGKQAFQGVLFFCKENKLICMSSDTYRLVRYAKEFSTDQSFRVLIPGKALSEVARIVMDDDGAITMYIGDSEVVFEHDDYTVSCRLFNSRDYPDLEHVFPKEAKTTLNASPALFGKILDRATLVADMDLCISINDGMMTVKAEEETGSMKEELSVEVMSGEELERVFFAPKFLLEPLRRFGGNGYLEIQFNGEFGPCIMQDENYKCLVLPIKKER